MYFELLSHEVLKGQRESKWIPGFRGNDKRRQFRFRTEAPEAHFLWNRKRARRRSDDGTNRIPFAVGTVPEGNEIASLKPEHSVKDRTIPFPNGPEGQSEIGIQRLRPAAIFKQEQLSPHGDNSFRKRARPVFATWQKLKFSSTPGNPR